MSQTGFRNIVLILCVIAVVLLAVNLVLTIPIYSAAPKVVMVETYPPTTPPKAEERLEGVQVMPSVFPSFPRGERTINVAGIGVAEGKPDRAIVSLSVITREDTAVKAYQLNAEKTNSVIAALKEAGIPEDRMETTGYSLNPVWHYPRGEEPVIIGYECRNSLKVTLEDLDRVGEVIDKGVNAGANQVSSVSFTLSKEAREKLKLEALSLAVKDAKAKAETIAEAAGVTLVGPTSISLSEIPVPTPVRLEVKGAPVPAPPEIIAPEELSVTVTVNVVYEFR
ncbi:TPA: DUF541 domain-containing protein [Candidatus Bathyarchaeota archaeon]|nr:DUF541 domain-containing protein [Candidatus Bathyarchaeota archaeon]